MCKCKPNIRTPICKDCPKEYKKGQRNIVSPPPVPPKTRKIKSQFL